MRRRPQPQVAAEQHHQQHRSPTHSPSREISRNPEAIRIELLGGFRLRVGSRVIEEDNWRLRKTRSLLKVLALAPRHRLHREQAMELLWPDLDPKAALNNFHYALHVARRTLEPAALASSSAATSRYLHLHDEQLMLCPDSPLWVDVEVFEEAATACHTLEPAAFRAAIDLYAGELLPEDRYEPWVEERRAELRGLYLSLLLELGELYEERKEFELGIEALSRVVAEEPTHEGAHAGLMRLYALLERRREALSQYERLRDALFKKFGTEPEAATTRLQQEIWAGTFPYLSDLPPTGFPAREEASSAAGGARRHNLPLARTSFIGRERETLEVKRLLAMTRLLTLTGAGGCGKTRLTLKVARDLVGTYPDGVWLVDLASLAEAELVPQAVAQAVGSREQPGRPLLETLKDALRTKKMLLVLDNCEHLIEAVVRVVDSLLDSCPDLRILATSRERLDTAGEVGWVVPSLTVPDTRGPSMSQNLEAYESVRLFLERARQRDPSFVLSVRNARAVAQVCKHLEGIPLAIELAAARIGTLSVEQVSKRLEGSLELLTRGGRTAVPRHRTLKGTLDWSYDLLSESERKVFRRLSVFRGWTLEASEAVGSGEGVAESEVLELLSGLVEKSLVVAKGFDEGGAHYRLLEPVRQYALEKLEGSGKAETTKCAHAGFFLAVAEEADSGLRGPQQGASLERLETEHDNMRVALSWALERAEVDLALRLGGALCWFWHMRGHLSEGRRWLEEALAIDARGSRSARAMALAAIGVLALDQGDLDRVEEVCEEGLELLVNEERGRSEAKLWLLAWLGYVAIIRGDHRRAEELSEQSLALSQEMRIRWWVAISISQLAHVSRVRGDSGRATELFEESIDLFREQGDKNLLAWCLTKLGLVAYSRSDLGRAEEITEEGVALLRELGSVAQAAIGLCNLGWILLVQDDLGRAAALYQESLVLGWDAGMNALILGVLEGFACVAGAQGETQRAAHLWGAAQALHERMGIPRDTDWLAETDARIAAVRSGLDELEWEEVEAEGKAMGLEEAVEYAFSEDVEEVEQKAPTLVAVSEQPPQLPADEPSERLTTREREVALLVGQGLTNRQIARELSISEKTVENHITKVLKKLGFSSRARIAAWVVQR